MSGVGGASGSGDPAGGAGGAGDPAAGTGGTSDSAADVERLTRALEAERSAHAATRQQLGELKNTQQTGGTPVTQAPNTQSQSGAPAPAEDRIGALIAQVQALTERAEAAEQAAVRSAVAKAYGLSEAQASRLVGKTKAELETDAAQLAKDFGIKVPGAEGGGDGTGEGGEGAGDGAGTGAANGQGAATGSAGTGAARRTTSTLRTGAANEGDAGRATSRSEADKIAEEVLGSGF